MLDPYSPQGKTWSCPQCGVIHAQVTVVNNRNCYTRQLCQCQKRELALIEKERMARWLRVRPEVA